MHRVSSRKLRGTVESRTASEDQTTERSGAVVQSTTRAKLNSQGELVISGKKEGW